MVPLTKRHAHKVSDTQFHADVDRLIRVLEVTEGIKAIPKSKKTGSSGIMMVSLLLVEIRLSNLFASSVSYNNWFLIICSFTSFWLKLNMASGALKITVFMGVPFRTSKNGRTGGGIKNQYI